MYFHELKKNITKCKLEKSSKLKTKLRIKKIKKNHLINQKQILI